MNKEAVIKLIKRAFKENPQTTTDLTLLSGYVWKYQGVSEDTNFEEFYIGLLQNRYTPVQKIASFRKLAKWEIANS